MSRILSIIVDFVPQDKLDKVTVRQLCDWSVFLIDLEKEGELSFNDIYSYLNKEFDKIDGKGN